ncbi:hypothetical protein Hanom_Chr03g00186761 [Helianthus anomalus]
MVLVNMGLLEGEFALERRVILIPEINEGGKTLRQDQQIRLRHADTTFVGPPVQPEPMLTFELFGLLQLNAGQWK